MNDNERKKLEKSIKDYLDTIKEVGGKEQVPNFIDMMTGLLVASGDKRAIISQLEYEIMEMLQNIVEKHVLIRNSNDETLDKIELFFTDIKNQIIDFSNELKNNY